jgi:hypothetical protein
MRLVEFITQTSVIDQILTPRRTRASREAHEHVSGYAAARQSALTRSVIAR